MTIGLIGKKIGMTVENFLNLEFQFQLQFYLLKKVEF